MNDREYEDALLERYGATISEARSLGYAVSPSRRPRPVVRPFVERVASIPRPPRKRLPAPFVPTDPLPGVCHACGIRDVRRFIGAGTYLPVCNECLDAA